MNPGPAAAHWLRVEPTNVAPDTVYHEIAPWGIYYDEEIGQLTCEGLRHTVRRWTPRQMMKHPRVEVFQFYSHADYWVVAYEIAKDLHRLLWPVVRPPSEAPGLSIAEGFERDKASLARREPYRAWDTDLPLDTEWLEKRTGLWTPPTARRTRTR